MLVPEQDSDPSERHSPFDFMRRRRRGGGPGPLLLGAMAVVAIGAAVAWLILRSPDPSAPEASEAGEAEAVSAAEEEEEEEIELPPLDASDQVVRALLVRLSSHPQLAAWLVSDELARRFVASVVRLAGGRSPTSEVEFLVPEEAFRARQSGGRTVIDSASYERFNLFTEVFVSLDTAGAATLYHRLRPLFVDAYEELGFRGGGWDEAFALAVEKILAARVPDESPPVIQVEGLYLFAQPAVESLSSAEKQLIRMGPTNARRNQAKLREIAQAVGV